MDSLKLKFTSGNDIPVSQAVITRTEYDFIQIELGCLQAKIDALMLEYCPEDMTKEQMKLYEESIVSVELSNVDYKWIKREEK